MKISHSANKIESMLLNFTHALQTIKSNIYFQELQQQKADMRNLVNELHEINTNAENTAKQRHQNSNEGSRVVPIDYQRIVPIELVGPAKNQPQETNGIANGHDPLPNGHCNGSVDHDMTDDNAPTPQNQDEEAELTEETSDLIKQKMADIATMKNQLKRLKDMMDTVKLIEDKTDGRSIQEIADEAEHLLTGNAPIRRETTEKVPSHRNSAQREIPHRVELSAEELEKTEKPTESEIEMTEKVRILHEMTQDLRSQAASLANERDRLKTLRDEMIRRKEAENMATSSATKRIPVSQPPKEPESDQLKAEFEIKKKEFEKLCERLQSDDDIIPEEVNARHPNESVENSKHSTNNSSSYYQDNWRQQNMVSSDSSVRGAAGDGKQSTIPPTPSRGKDSADSGAADVHGIASFEAGSMQSGSSRSFSMPPPMRTMNARDPVWRKNSQDNSQSQFEFYAPMPPPLPTWSSSYYYSTPYAQHFNPHPHHHPVNPAGNEYFCGHNCHPANAMGQAGTSMNSSQPQTSQQPVLNTNDPVLLQQFIQTQQMLINSVCQCNQLLWHQQREINNLNNAVMLVSLEESSEEK